DGAGPPAPAPGRRRSAPGGALRGGGRGAPALGGLARSLKVRRPARLAGEVALPGDKSISHRALILNALAEGRARVTNLSPGGDVASTAACLGALGVEIEPDEVSGVGLHGLRAAAAPLDCGNSGT